MPLFNAIGQPRWNSPLIRFFGMKIGSAAAPSLAPEIAPSFDVNQQDDPQIMFLRGEKLAGYGSAIAAAVGFYSTAQIRNPSGSGVLAIIDAVQAYSAAAWVNLSISQTSDLTSSGACTARDSRWQPQGTTSVRYGFRNDSAGALTGARFQVIRTGTLGLIPISCVLHPGYSLVIETSVVNADLTWGADFRERAIPAEELSTG